MVKKNYGGQKGTWHVRNWYGSINLWWGKGHDDRMKAGLKEQGIANMI